jgi:hypothetical protein
LICISLVAKHVKHFLHAFIDHLCFLPLRTVYSSSHLFIGFIELFFILVFTFSEYESLIEWIAGKDFLPVCWLSFHPANCFFAVLKLSNLM